MSELKFGNLHVRIEIWEIVRIEILEYSSETLRPQVIVYFDDGEWVSAEWIHVEDLEPFVCEDELEFMEEGIDTGLKFVTRKRKRVPRLQFCAIRFDSKELVLDLVAIRFDSKEQ